MRISEACRRSTRTATSIETVDVLATSVVSLAPARAAMRCCPPPSCRRRRGAQAWRVRGPLSPVGPGAPVAASTSPSALQATAAIPPRVASVSGAPVGPGAPPGDRRPATPRPHRRDHHHGIPCVTSLRKLRSHRLQARAEAEHHCARCERKPIRLPRRAGEVQRREPGTAGTQAVPLVRLRSY